jgi:hypothetical protein
VDAPVQPLRLLPHLPQREVVPLTDQFHLDPAEPVTRVFDDERRLRAGRHRSSGALTPSSSFRMPRS